MAPEVGPRWLKPLVDNLDQLSAAFRDRLPSDAVALLAAEDAKAGTAGSRRDAAVLVLLSGPETADPVGGPPPEADLLVTVRAGTLRQHAGQAAFPGGVADADDAGPVATALREAHEETGLDTSRLHPLATMDRLFIPPSGFHVVPVLAYSPDPGPVHVVDAGETAIVSRVPLRAFINPENRLMISRDYGPRRWTGPAFLLNQMLVWGFTAQVISAMLTVAGWEDPWDTTDVHSLDEALDLVGSGRPGGATR
ncbi:MAG TPA: CoA pyrophosphatase [Mycobacterium sp.]|nr:CoA pyrophosphatase [Mycobacterium sp.]